MENLSSLIKTEVEAVCMRSVRADESLVISGVLDSVALVDLAVALEKSLGVKLPLDALNADSFDTLAKIESVIKSKMSL